VLESGSSGAGVDETLDLNDGGDMRPPIGSRERFSGIEDGDRSAFKATSRWGYGEHGGDPASVAFCKQVGLDYVSCQQFSFCRPACA
jgi:hypothetical protein